MKALFSGKDGTKEIDIVISDEAQKELDDLKKKLNLTENSTIFDKEHEVTIENANPELLKIFGIKKKETFESSVLRSIHDNLDDGTDTRVRQCVKEIVQLHDLEKFDLNCEVSKYKLFLEEKNKEILDLKQKAERNSKMMLNDACLLIEKDRKIQQLIEIFPHYDSGNGYTCIFCGRKTFGSGVNVTCDHSESCFWLKFLKIKESDA
jgi:hypothetical protein